MDAAKEQEGAKFDEMKWRRRHGVKTIKTLDLYSAATDAKALAEKAGWTHVEIIELKKGDSRGLLWG